jgi:16S rRNA C967 or C1407 C5-methylase (RsmB/RsmF family)
MREGYVCRRKTHIASLMENKGHYHCNDLYESKIKAIKN